MFQVRHVAGLTATVVEHDDDATLDIDFDRIGGGLARFTHCREVRAERLAQVQPSQATLARMLQLNCQALHRYVSSRPAHRSLLPGRWSVAAVGSLPGPTLPRLVPAAAASAGTETLSHAVGRRRISVGADGVARVRSAELLALYHLLARADFDADGLEDWLLRIDWAALHGDARGSELVLVSRVRRGAPVQVLWRAEP
ncbi:MAG: hypothetical protein HY855_21045 [Burkholderiales bacterium]|nr:hypothetical protein [Burkholderiales bacterium]